jgi:hypothetical protein
MIPAGLSSESASGSVSVEENASSLRMLKLLLQSSSSVEDPLLKKCHEAPRLCLSDLLIELIYLESADFMTDIIETDNVINEREVGRPDTSASGAVAVDSSLPQSGGKAALPVAELIVSSHLSMLLVTLSQWQKLQQCTDKDVTEYEKGKSASDSGNVPSFGSRAYVPYEKGTPSSIRSRLPRGTWWYLVRILKGYLNLQEQVFDRTVRNMF